MNRFSNQILPFLIAWSLAPHACANGDHDAHSKPHNLSLLQLETRLVEIDKQLRLLAPNSLRSGIGVIGYRSDSRGSPERLEWVEVQLDKEYPIDEIVLVPTIRRDTKAGFRSDAFPQVFRILAGTTEDREGTVVAEYSFSDELQPRVGPVVVPLTDTTASWVRVEATELSLRAFDAKPVLQIAELMVFSDTENVALRQSVTASTSISNDVAGAWSKEFLVDGHTPYLMDSSTGSQSLAYVSQPGDQPMLNLDLGAQYPISRIHLHAVDQGDTVPQAFAGDLGIPSRLRMEGASRDDFKDAKTLLEYQRRSGNELGPIMMWRIPETTCRFVRLVALEEDPINGIIPSNRRIGFAEIELFSGGKNVALNKPASTDIKPEVEYRSVSALTDGKNLFGQILPIRDWMNELALRHDLMTERPIVAAELNRRYAQQRIQVRWLKWLAALLAVGIGVTFLIQRMVRMRQLSKLRIRFAADLHDELGANLHVIGLLSDLAQAAVDSPTKQKSLHQRIRIMTQRSGDAVQYCTNMIEAKGLYGGLIEDMQRATDRIMADLEGEFTFQGDKKFLRKIKPRARVDLFLLYKECLVNISRHSEGTRFSATLSANPEQLCLAVSDNGHGLTDPNVNAVPPSLMRRARLLGASVTAQSNEHGGTSIIVNFPNRKWGFRN